MGAIVVSPLIHHVAAHPLPSNVQILLIDRRIHFVDSKAATRRPIFQAMLRPAYLSKKLNPPIPTKDGGTLRTIQEGCEYMAAISWQLRLAILKDQASPVRALVAHMTTARTHFTFRVDTWTSEGESIVEHVAGVEDYEIAFSPPTVPPADANLAHPSPCGWVHEESRTADACEWCRGN